MSSFYSTSYCLCYFSLKNCHFPIHWFQTGEILEFKDWSREFYRYVQNNLVLEYQI
jgi:hypothetical protein